MLELGGPPRPRCQHILAKAFGEDTLPAKDSVTPKAPRHNDQPYWSASHGEIEKAAMVSAVNPLRNPPASRAGAGFALVADRDQRAGITENRALRHKSPRHQCRRPKTLLHGVDSLRTNASQHLNFIKSESEPKLHADSHWDGWKRIDSPENTVGPSMLASILASILNLEGSVRSRDADVAFRQAERPH